MKDRNQFAFLAALCLGSLLSAQATITVAPQPLHVGGKGTVTVHDPAHAGQTVTVTITNPDPGNPAVATLQIALDASGNGSKVWVVLAWEAAVFSVPGAESVTVPID